MNIPGIVLAGTTSGVGKTTITMAIIHGLQLKGFNVQPFKIGPDYIDPSYHNAISKNKRSKNLDIWLMGKNGVIESYFNAISGSDFSILEGVMGLFDGFSGKNNYASTAHISNILKIPIILIVDASKTSRSLAAITLGFMKFDKTIRIEGIIINNLASERHLQYVKEAFKSKIKAPIVGAIFKNKTNELKERHLGLVPTAELSNNKLKNLLETSKEISLEIDIDKVIEIGKKKMFQNDYMRTVKKSQYNKTTDASKKTLSIAIDKSFNFYYQDNIELLQNKVNLEFFSPIDTKSISSDSCGIIIGGGFPEVIADKLEKNVSIKNNILKLAYDSMPIYAECGGLMYLTKSITGYKDNKKKYNMVGLFDAETNMNKKLTLGYTEATLIKSDTILGNIKKIRGHEFHYSNIIINDKDSQFAYSLKKGKGIVDNKDGLILHNCLASYMHTHFINAKILENFLHSCEEYHKK